MFNGMNGILPVMDVDGNRNDGGFGDGGWWAWIILFALFGWGGNGFGFGGGNGTQAGFTDAAVQRGFDQSTIVSKLDGITNGICDASYAALAQTNGINTNIMQGNFGLQTAINGLGSRLASCCCDTQRSIDGVRYDMATDTCAITTAVNQGFAQLDRTINDKFCDLEMKNMQRTIDEQASLIQSLNLAQSQANQNQYLINQLRPCPTPAYITCNPWSSNGTSYNGCNGYSGCGCGSY